MGHDYKGGAETYHCVKDNISNLASRYPYSNGFFGSKGNSSNEEVRHIEAVSPIDAARDFYERAAYGGIEEILGPNKWKTTMEDGTVFTMRETSSSDKSPAVDINIHYSNDSDGLKKQKIHFIRRKDHR